jgi:hypothetical protein
MKINGFSGLTQVIAPASLAVVCLLASAPSYALQTGTNKVVAVAPALQTGTNKVVAVAPALQTGTNKVVAVAPALQTGTNKVARAATSATSGFSAKTAAQKEECQLAFSLSGGGPCNY